MKQEASSFGKNTRAGTSSGFGMCLVRSGALPFIEKRYRCGSPTTGIQLVPQTSWTPTISPYCFMQDTTTETP